MRRPLAVPLDEAHVVVQRAARSEAISVRPAGVYRVYRHSER